MMGGLSFFVILGGMLFIHQEPYDDKLADQVARQDKTGVFAFVIIVALFIFSYWTFDRVMELPLAGFIIVAVSIALVFIVATILLLLSTKQLLNISSKPVTGQRS